MVMFRPPVCNLEIPKSRSAFMIKKEEDILNIQKGLFNIYGCSNIFYIFDVIGVGVAAASNCSVVDASRSLLDDLMSMAHDFANGTLEDPVADAIEVFQSET